MAKVTGPLFSLTASGSVGKTIVYSRWKGSAYVRELVIPKNMMSEDQGDNRQILGGIGRAASIVSKTSDFEQQMIDLAVIPAGQSKQSFLVSYIKSHYCANATAFEAEVTALAAHTAKTDFQSAAVAAGLADLDIEYKGTTSAFTAGLQLYLVAKAAIALGFTGEPYATALASWDTSEISALIADCEPVA